jgi:CheY-like chemotaxis protein
MTSRLLVADDSITIQKIVAMAFETEGVEVEGIGDGQEAFDRIAEFNPDIVLADVDMPGLNGFELSAKIKESSEMRAIKVLLLASDFEDFDEQRYQSCGADNHISKPFKSDDIVAMVKSLLSAPSGDAEVEENPSEITDPEIIEKPEVELASETLSDIDSPEPSLEELLESVEKLSTDGTELSDAENEDVPEPISEEEDALSLTDEDLPEPISEEDETLALTDEDLQEPMELTEPVELSVEDLTETLEVSEPQSDIADIETAAMEASELLATPAGLEPEEANTDDDIMDQMIRGVEDLKESVQSSDSSVEEVEDFFFEAEEPDSEEQQEAEDALNYADEPEIFAEVRQRKQDNMEDLDSTFKEIVMGGGPARQEEIADSRELSSLGGIVLEPEDLLERITPGTFTEVGKRPATPEDIKVNLDYISESSDPGQDREVASLHDNLRSESWNSEAGNDPFTQAIADEVKRLLQRSLGSSLEKEVSGLSEVILKTIREVVREITPAIARKVIREEIEKIKKQDMF